MRQKLPDAFRGLAAAGAMASAPVPFDPMEKAFHALAQSDPRPGETLPGAGRVLARGYALAPDVLAMPQVWRAPGQGWQVAAKGAPEAVAGLCCLSSNELEQAAKF